MLFARQLEAAMWDTYMQGFHDGMFKGYLCGFAAGALAFLVYPIATYAPKESVGLVKNTTELIWSIAHCKYMI